MSKLSEYQKKYSDTINATVRHTNNDTMSLNQIRSLANSIHGENSTILEGRSTRQGTTIYVSKEAFEAGEKDRPIIFG